MTATTLVPSPAIVYPESDGKPMADNSIQLQWIVVLYDNLKALFQDNPQVYVGANMMWYPVEGEPDIKEAPDVFVVFGRPKGHRPSWRQWEEQFTPLTVVFEILSPSNTVVEMDKKYLFYEEHGVEEYYRYDPSSNLLFAYWRGEEALVRVRQVDGHVSSRLRIRFQMTSPEMTVYHPDGRRFFTFEEVETARRQAEQRAETAEQRLEKTARLAELSRKARRGQATAGELQDLERLEAELLPPA